MSSEDVLNYKMVPTGKTCNDIVKWRPFFLYIMLEESGLNNSSKPFICMKLDSLSGKQFDSGVESNSTIVEWKYMHVLYFKVPWGFQSLQRLVSIAHISQPWFSLYSFVFV